MAEIGRSELGVCIQEDCQEARLALWQSVGMVMRAGDAIDRAVKSGEERAAWSNEMARVLHEVHQAFGDRQTQVRLTGVQRAVLLNVGRAIGVAHRVIQEGRQGDEDGKG